MSTGQEKEAESDSAKDWWRASLAENWADPTQRHKVKRMLGIFALIGVILIAILTVILIVNNKDKATSTQSAGPVTTDQQTKPKETNEAPSAAEAAMAFERYSMQDYVSCVSAAMTIHAACTSANDTTTPGCIAAKYQVYNLYPNAMNSLIASGVSSTTERDAYMNNEMQKQQIYNQTLSPEAQLQQALEKDNSCIEKHGHLAKYVSQ
jgi:hypothetical protein